MEKQKDTENTQKKNKRRSFLPWIILILLLFGAVAAAWFLKVSSCEIIGNTHVEGTAITAVAFPDEDSKRILNVLKRFVLGYPKTPGIASMKPEFIDFDSVGIHVAEDEPVLRIETLDRMIVVNSDGIVLGDAHEEDMALPLVVGIQAMSGECLQLLGTEDEKLISDLMSFYSASIATDVTYDRIVYSNDGFSIEIGSITVLFGRTRFMEDSMMEMKSQLSSLEGLSGVLHLEDFDPTAVAPVYYFEVITE